MTIDEYQIKFPEQQVWRGDNYTPRIAEGMILFDEDSACNLAGPFEGNYAYFTLTDYRTAPGWNLHTEEWHQARNRYCVYHLPYKNRPRNPAENEDQLQRRLDKLTEKERRAWQVSVDGFHITCPTVEKPVALFIAGNDDSTYTRYFVNVEEGQEALDLLLAIQPLSWNEAIAYNGFVFTN